MSLRFFRTPVKRCWNDHGLYAQAANLDFQFLAEIGKFKRHIGERDVFLEERRWRSAGDIADLATFSVENLIIVARDAALHHLQSDQSASRRDFLRSLEPFATNELRFFHFAETVEVRFP